MRSPNPGRVAVARLLRPQGRQGELLVEPLSDLPGLFPPGRRLWTAAETAETGSERPPFEVQKCWEPTGRNAGRIVLKLRGIDSISAAEAIAGQTLFLQQAELPPRDADTFLVGDLLGCVLYDGDREAGEVVDVQFAMAPDGRTRVPEAAPLLVVQHRGSPAQEPGLVPFVKAWLQGVDLDHKRIRMTLPAGLLSTELTLHNRQPATAEDRNPGAASKSPHAF